MIIRSHFVDDALRHFANALAADPAYQIILALDAACGITQVEGFPVVSLSTDECARHGLYTGNYRPFWRCGDYALALAQEAHPGFAYYWMTEYDVVINRPSPAGFLAEFDAASKHDFLAVYLREAKPDWAWHARMAPFYERVYSCFFPLLRISASALTALYGMRRDLYASHKASFDAAPETWPNDEVFTATSLVNAGFACANFNDVAPAYTNVSMTNARKLWHKSQLSGADGLVYHPVRAGAAYIEAALRFGLPWLPLIPTILAEARNEPNFPDLLFESLRAALANAEDDPAKVFAAGGTIAQLLDAYPPRTILVPLAAALESRQLQNSLDWFRRILSTAPVPSKPG